MTRLPLFPLGTVLFPGLPLPLQVFEQRYRRLVDTLQARPVGERRFGVIGIRAGHEVGTSRPELYDVGCVADLRRVVERDDGLYDVLSVGVGRFRLHEVHDEDGLAVGEVDLLEEQEGPDDAALAGRVRLDFGDYVRAVRASRGVADAVPPELPSGPFALSFAVAGAALLSLPQKQMLLDAPSVADRLRLELDLLRQETGYVKDLNTLPGVTMSRPPIHPN